MIIQLVYKDHGCNNFAFTMSKMLFNFWFKKHIIIHNFDGYSESRLLRTFFDFVVTSLDNPSKFTNILRTSGWETLCRSDTHNKAFHPILTLKMHPTSTFYYLGWIIPTYLYLSRSRILESILQNPILLLE